MANESGTPIDGATQQGGNPVPGLETRGNDEFNEMLKAPAPSGNAGNASKAPTLPTKKLEETTGVEPTTETTTEATKPASSTAAAPSQADLVRATVEATIAGMTKQNTVAAPKKELSQDDFDKKFRIPKVTDAEIVQLFDTDPKKAAAWLNSKIQAASTSGVLMAQELFEARLAEMQSKFTPHIESWTNYQRQQAEAKAESDFYTAHPDLVDEKELVEEVKLSMITRVNAGQIKFTSQQEANKAVAEAAKKIVARMRAPVTAGAANGAQSGAQTASPAKPAGGRTMAAASSAGRSGTGKAATPSDVELIFGADAR